MISFDFEYYKPTSIYDAVQTYEIIHSRRQKAMFFSGGTEFITFARKNMISANAIIDLKDIPECQALEFQGEQLIIGAAVSLNKINESKLFPLLGETVKKVADHTSRNKITIGGNILSRLMYCEGLLPLLLANAKVRIMGSEGEEILALADIVDQKLTLKPGHLLVQILVDKTYTDCHYVSLKKTRQSKVGYPLISVSALLKDGRIRAAFSGICKCPFRSLELEDALNNTKYPKEGRIEMAVKCLPAEIVDDFQGSAKYRRFVLKNILHDVIENLEGESS